MTEKPTYEELEKRVRELEKVEIDRKIVLDALRESEDRYRSFVQNFIGIAFQGRMDFTPNQKAIIISGFAETDDVKKIQALGAGKYIKKPVTLETLGLAIWEELRK